MCPEHEIASQKCFVFLLWGFHLRNESISINDLAVPDLCLLNTAKAYLDSSVASETGNQVKNTRHSPYMSTDNNLLRDQRQAFFFFLTFTKSQGLCWVVRLQQNADHGPCPGACKSPCDTAGIITGVNKCTAVQEK